MWLIFLKKNINTNWKLKPGPLALYTSMWNHYTIQIQVTGHFKRDILSCPSTWTWIMWFCISVESQGPGFDFQFGLKFLLKYFLFYYYRNGTEHHLALWRIIDDRDILHYTSVTLRKYLNKFLYLHALSSTMSAKSHVTNK